MRQPSASAHPWSVGRRCLLFEGPPDERPEPRVDMSGPAEIGIVGAGPAGARAAELLASCGHHVVMLDPKAPWEKPCGGGLTPPAFDVLPELDELKPVARRASRVRVEAEPGRGFVVALERPIWMISRRTLGEWQLRRALAAGAVHLPLKVDHIERAESGVGWRLHTQKGEMRVRVLVGADGAASLVRRVVAPAFKIELEPTRVAYPPGVGPMPDTALLRFYEGVAGYLWDFPRPDHRSVGIVVPQDTWRRRRLDLEIDGYRTYAGCPEDEAVDRAGAVIGTAQLGHGDYGRIAGPDFALIGDAAGFADPLTGEGIQNALHSAELVAEAWSTGSLAAYPELARRAFEREFRTARLVRRYLFESGVGMKIIRRGLEHGASYAFAAACVNELNDRRGGLAGVLRRWIRASLRRAVATDLAG